MNRSTHRSPAWIPLALFLAGFGASWGPSLFAVAAEQPSAMAQARMQLRGHCAAVSGPVAAGQPEKAAALADGIWASPREARCLLQRHDMSTEDFESLMERIAGDEGLSIRYAEARRLGPVL